MMQQRIQTYLLMTLSTAVCHMAYSANLTLWANQLDLRAAAGDPNTHLVPSALTYNPVLEQLMIACGGSNGSILEWSRGASSGTLLVPRTNWGSGSSPSVFAAAYVPNRDAYLIAAGGNEDALLEVIPGVTGQVPAVYLTPAAGTYPAGGLVTDAGYAYYKNQWTGVQQTVNRVNLDGPPTTETQYVTPAMFSAFGLAGPSQQLAMDSTGKLYLSGRPSSGMPNTVRAIYTVNEDFSALEPVLGFAEITTFTGKSNVRIYGMTFDRLDALYFYELYSASIIRRDRFGTLSTLVTNDEIRDWFGDQSMQVHPSYMVVVNDQLVCVSGNVSGHVFAIDLPLVEPDLATVPGTDYEPNGPTYSYHINRFEQTNAQYCIFLNDAEKAQQTDPNDPRCSHMWFHPSNGDVYMTDVTVWPYGSEWYNRTLYKTSDLPDSKIKYDSSQAPGSRFYVLAGFDHHPVGTVSWYGAAKYCNWMTIRNGFGKEHCCYTEGINREDWIPITASDWENQGLLLSERFELVRHYRGYRLPMDGVNVDYSGPGVAHSWNIAANPYNEWYKAAAWDPNAPDTVRPGPGDYEVVQPDHWIFGFGSDAYDPADGNTGQSITIFPETTPVGWYNGVNKLADETLTRNTRNRYGMYDMAGNVSEWVNDTALGYPWGPTYRAQRGGQYDLSDLRWCTNTYRSIYTARYYAENNEGFRIMRSSGFGDFDGNCSVDFEDFHFMSDALSGPTIPITPGSGYETCDGDGDSDLDVMDFGLVQRLGGWTCPNQIN